MLVVASRPDASSPVALQHMEEGEGIRGVFLSPRGDRATILVNYAFEGDVPVFDSLGGVAWRAHRLRRSAGVAFNTDGSKLLMAGYDVTDLPEDVRVQLHDATTGSVLAT